MPAYPPHYAELRTRLREVANLAASSALLSWDQETYMPPAGAAARAEQLALMASLAHERRTHPRVGELIAACEQDASLAAPGTRTGADIREMRRDYDLATRLPTELVAALAKTTSEASEAWKAARQKSDFPAFLPWLDKVFALTRRKAECYGVPAGGELYDALLNEYEPGATAREIASVFTPLRARLSDLIRRVRDSRTKVSTRPLKVEIDPARQHAFGQWVIAQMGFDLAAGRLDVTTHPFCSGLAHGDTRLTTRYREEHFTDALYSTLHEMGHGLYEQGLPKGEHFGQPLAEAVSLGIHESQSRLWENFVGRSKAFWKWALPRSRRHFGKALSRFDARDFFAAVNTVKPSLIRVEADEGTYNLHVMIRFEIERGLLGGSISTRDLPAEWNRRYMDYLGLDVPDDRRGCMQDVHWSFGLIGYFPTYTLGNLYAAQFWDKAADDADDLNRLIGKGRFAPLLEWLRANIHRHGKRYRATELCRRVTGRPLSAEPLLAHLARKAEQVYGV